MASKSLFSQMQKIRGFSSTQRNFNVHRVIYNKPAADAGSMGSSSSAVSGDVPGLSDKVYSTTSEPVGPGATKESPKYKNPEYFCYHEMSYCEAEIEMAQYRCPQPSNQHPHKQ